MDGVVRAVFVNADSKSTSIKPTTELKAATAARVSTSKDRNGSAYSLIPRLASLSHHAKVARKAKPSAEKSVGIVFVTVASVVVVVVSSVSPSSLDVMAKLITGYKKASAKLTAFLVCTNMYSRRYCLWSRKYKC